MTQQPPHGYNPQQPYGQQPPQQGQPQYGQQPPQQFAPPPPPKKKFPKWLIVVGVIVVILIIFAATGGGGDKDEAKSSDSSSQSSGNDSKPDDNGAPIGTEVRDGKFGFVVTNVDIGKTTIGTNEYLKEDAQGQFVLVTIDVSNTSDEPQSYFGQNQKLFDAQGREFANNFSAEMNVNDSNLLIGDINPGNKITVTVVFDIPKDAVPVSIELHDSAFSGGVKAALK
ncbi:DUF4352 domain-containing protein [Antrihabitans sp. YC3-6]|uniref:DUF4352 domain-containing protein n=1 Tax=Antrihabitans stalagmiti TaxID=2799499 RepID=A0A934NTC8_9NOCA|nr:DUF4352 domain-containing protein [Antrihabitans stalagmiti]MBJ8341188.1 DUF4352 domain-containing protein [Antrihabitans stalagmiti]